MKKFSFLLVTLIFLAACNFNNDNSVSLINHEEDEEEDAVIQNGLSDIDYTFEYEANNDEFSNLNIWVDEYVDGKKEDTILSLSSDLREAEGNEGELTFAFDDIMPEHSEGESVDFRLSINQKEDTVSGMLTDTDIEYHSRYSISYGPVIRDSAYTLTEDEEVVAAMIALNDASRMPLLDLEPDMPTNIEFEEHIKEVASDIDVLYIMKIQFTEEV